MATQFAAYATSFIVAHQGGWDEILLIAGPIAVVAGLLVLAKKRVDAAAEATREMGTEPDRRTDPRSEPRPDPRSHPRSGPDAG